jgi:pimeloyl-ACP methyl ester carboxylesterase
VIFGANDPIFMPALGVAWLQMIPGATLDIIERARHFCQEDVGADTAACPPDHAAQG